MMNATLKGMPVIGCWRLGISLAVGGLLAGGLMASPKVNHPDYSTLIAHRGESIDAPENTLPAYRMAVERGFGFECDVYLSKDNRVFTFHDHNLSRVTGGACTQLCTQVSWEETLSKLDVGSYGKWKNSKYAGTRPALLEEVLELARDGRYIYIEVKGWSGVRIVPYIRAILEKQNRANAGNVLFVSFHADICAALKRELPAYRVYMSAGWIKWIPTAARVVELLKQTGADGVFVCCENPKASTKEYMDEIKRAGFEVHGWTLDRLDLALQAFANGAKTVTTNRAKKLLEEYNQSVAAGSGSNALESKARPKDIGNRDGVVPPYACRDSVPEIVSKATGYFRVEKMPDGKWWGIDPNGKGFLFKAVQSAHINGCNDFLTERRPYLEHNRRRWPSTAAWETNCIERLQLWGFNMLGQGCAQTMEHRGLVHARQLDLGFSFANLKDPDCAIVVYRGHDNACSAFPNVFNPKFAEHCRSRAAKLCTPRRSDPWLVGWYLDNELLWWGDSKLGSNPRSIGIYETVARLPKTHSARKALDAFLSEHGWKPGAKVPQETKKDFLMLVAERYFSIATAAVREADPNHLILGARFAGIEGCADYDVYRPCGRHCDIVTFNCYPYVDLRRNTCQACRGDSMSVADRFAKVVALAEKPIMITEWSFLAYDAGLPCGYGAGQRFGTQQERARAAEVYVRQMMAMPGVVGWNYFRWVDQEPSGGSMFNREDSNYGLVNDRDEAYPIAETLGRLQNDVYRLRNAQPLPEKPAEPDPGPAKMLQALKRPDKVLFVRKDDAFAIDAGCGFVCEGKKGDFGPLPQLRLEDQQVGSVTGRLNHFGEAGAKFWPELGRIESFAWEPVEDGCGRLTVELKGASKGMTYASTVRMTFTPGSSSVLIEILRVANVGDKPIDVRRIYMAPMPVDIPGVRPYPSSYSISGVMDGIDRTAWVYPDGRVLGATTRASHVAVFHYKMDNGGRKYADIAFLPEAFNGNKTGDAARQLAPGAEWRPVLPPWLFVRATTFGEGKAIPTPLLTKEEGVRIGQERAAGKRAR